LHRLLSVSCPGDCRNKSDYCENLSTLGKMRHRSASRDGRLVLNLPPLAVWGARTQTVAVRGSTNGSSFGTLPAPAGRRFDPAGGNTVTVTFPATPTRYVRLEFTGNTGWPAGQLSELEVYPGQSTPDPECRTPRAA